MIFGTKEKISKWTNHSISVFADFENTYISRKTVGKLIGPGHSNKWLVEYLSSFERFGHSDKDLIENLTNPKTITLTYDKDWVVEVISSDILFKACRFILEAKKLGLIGVLDLKIADLAEKLIALNTLIPLKAFIQENSGRNEFLNRIRQQTAQQVEKIIGPMGKWIQRIPEEFLNGLMRLTGADLLAPNAPLELSFSLQEIFRYIPDTLRGDLENRSPKRQYRRKNYGPQDIGHPEFEKFLWEMSLLLKTSDYKAEEWKLLLHKTYGRSFRPDAKKPESHLKAYTPQETQIRTALYA